jgi:phosphoribosyl-dephospho-CoA transferase
VTLRRHDLLRVEPKVWDAMLVRHPGLGDLPLVADWARKGWPVIVRRPMAADEVGGVPAAVPLPPSHGKRRVAFSFPAGAAVSPLPPVLLRDAAPSAPAAWAPVITGLLALGAPRVFGALLWQHVTGLPYLTAQSDLDLLWAIDDPAVAETLVSGLLRLDGAPRLDGEIEVHDGGGVNWRELALGGGDTVLVKTMAKVALRARQGLFSP